jgi:hypothetical protein
MFGRLHAEFEIVQKRTEQRVPGFYHRAGKQDEGPLKSALVERALLGFFALKGKIGAVSNETVRTFI